MRAGADGGFTLVEALVALAILGLGVTAALELSARTLRTQAAAERHLEAVTLAEAKMNELAILPSTSLEQYAGIESGNVGLGGRSYSWQAVVRREPGTTTLWRAAVRIEWEDGDFDLETVLYHPDRRRRLR